jgi:hypothetical protein
MIRLIAILSMILSTSATAQQVGHTQAIRLERGYLCESEFQVSQMLVAVSERKPIKEILEEIPGCNYRSEPMPAIASVVSHFIDVEYYVPIIILDTPIGIKYSFLRSVRITKAPEKPGIKS